MNDPKYLIHDGKLVEWDSAHVHLWSEAPKRAINVFDAIRAHYNAHTDSYHFIALKRHLDRLLRSASEIGFPKVVSFEDLIKGVAKLVLALDSKTDMYVRPTIYLSDGGYEVDPEKMKCHWYIVAFSLNSTVSDVSHLTTAISPWQKIPSAAFPATIKCGASYALTRVSRVFAHNQGVDEPLLVNQSGNVCETPGASIVVIKDDVAVTPPVEDGVLDGVTRDHILSLLAEEKGYKTVIDSIVPAQLFSADAIFLCGTLQGIGNVVSCDGREVGSETSRALALDISGAYERRIGSAESPVSGWVEILNGAIGEIEMENNGG